MKTLLLICLVATGLAQAGEIARSVSPSVLHTEQAQYTAEALAEKVEGSVRLSVVVGEDGLLSDIVVIRSLGKGLDEKAIESLKGWRFKPATYDAKPVAQKILVEIAFHLPK